MSIIIYGIPVLPVHIVELLRKHYKMEQAGVIDFDPYPLSPTQIIEFKEGKILFLTNINPDVNGYHDHYGRVISFKEAIREINNEN